MCHMFVTWPQFSKERDHKGLIKKILKNSVGITEKNSGHVLVVD